MKKNKTVIGLFVVYIMLVLLLISYARHMNGDEIGDLIIAKMTSMDGLYPSTMWYSTTTPNYVGYIGVESLLFLFFHDFEIVYVLAHAIELAVAFILLYLFFRMLKRPLDAIDFFLLLCPSACIMQFLWVEGFYLWAINSIILNILLLNCYLNQKYNSIFLLAVACSLGFGLGCSGLKPFMWVYVPFFLATVIINVFKMCKKQEGKKFFIFAGISLFGGILGYMFCKGIIEKRCPVVDYTSMEFVSSSELGTRMLVTLGKVFELFGYSNTGETLMSVKGIYQCLTILVSICIIYAAIVCVRQLCKDKLDEIKKFIVVVAIVASVFMCFLLVCLKSEISTPYLVTTCFLWCTCFIVIGRKYIDFKIIEKSKILYASFYMGICLWGVLSIRVSYETFILANVDRTAAMEMAIDSIYDNDLKVGYASFWNAERVTGKSDMDLKVANISISESGMEYFHWLSPKENYDPFKEERSFVLVENGTEKENFVKAEKTGGGY